MLDLATLPLELPPHLSAQELESIKRRYRVFGLRGTQQFVNHLANLSTHKPWFVYVDQKGARYFTHFKKLENPVKNPRSITGSQKFIAKNDSSPGFLF